MKNDVIHKSEEEAAMVCLEQALSIDRSKPVPGNNEKVF